MDQNRERLSMDEVEAENATSLPNKEVLSLLDVNANVDLGLDLAAPVDLAAAANLNVAAPIEAAAGANVLSPGAQAVAVAHQSGSIDQGISGEATAHATQNADLSQNANPAETGGATTGGTAGTSTGNVGSLLNGGSLVDANVNIHANANLTAPIDGAVAANANVAAPVDVAAAANVASPGAGAEALAPQEIHISQHLDGVKADATGTQDATVNQK